VTMTGNVTSRGPDAAHPDPNLSRPDLR